MIELILIIIICVTIYKRVQSAKGGGGVRGNQSLPNTTVTTANSRPQNANPNPYAGQNGKRGLFLPHSAPKSPAYGQTVSGQSARAAIQEAKEDGHSTTAYLMEKAEADAREHAKEKYEEQKRLYETRGGLAVADRYLEGEMVPNGKKCINCGYCGAENLIPAMPKTRYSCYFCREPLN